MPNADVVDSFRAPFEGTNVAALFFDRAPCIPAVPETKRRNCVRILAARQVRQRAQLGLSSSACQTQPNAQRVTPHRALTPVEMLAHEIEVRVVPNNVEFLDGEGR